MASQDLFEVAAEVLCAIYYSDKCKCGNCIPLVVLWQVSAKSAYSATCVYEIRQESGIGECEANEYLWLASPTDKIFYAIYQHNRSRLLVILSGTDLLERKWG